jgi:hypothetical protein
MVCLPEKLKGRVPLVGTDHSTRAVAPKVRPESPGRSPVDNRKATPQGAMLAR